MDHNLRSVEAHEVAKDKHSKAWNEVYTESYERLPNDFGGMMLREAVDSIQLGDIIDDIIISSYADGDREAAVTALFLLLDGWRKRQAERVADKETGE
jgi:hypothetical protein